jgi:F-type H+-transporting ATPase subunit delta
VNPALQGYVAAVIDAAGDEERRQAAEDLAAVDRLFQQNGELRASLSDPAVPGAARRAVLEDLLSGKVSEPARHAAGYAVAAVRAPEVSTAMAWLAHRSAQSARGREIVESPLSHTEARERVRGFADALFEEMQAEQLADMEEEVFRFASVVQATPSLQAALSDRELPGSVRQGIVDDLIGGKVQVGTQRLIGYVASAGRPRDNLGTLLWLVEEIARARGWRVAQVQAGQEVVDDERRQLAGSLSRLTGSPVELQVTVDPSLLAGVRVQIGDLLLDATARDRLEQLRQHVASVSGGWEGGTRSGRSGASRSRSSAGPS